MDSFGIIQNFFTRMRCHFCSAYLEPEGIKLLREEKDVYIVRVQCVHCSRQMGIAMVGIDQESKKLEDPELTVADLKRLSKFEPIEYNDVIDAHKFFSNLESDWKKYLPPEMRQLEIEPLPESEAS